MSDDWRPVKKAHSPGWVCRTFHDGQGKPYHYDHNKGEFVEGMWKASAALKDDKDAKNVKRGDDAVEIDNKQSRLWP